MSISDLPCNQIAELISRHLDDDLNKEERWQVYHHTTCCPECQTEMEELAALEVELSTWSRSFNTHTLDSQFNTKIQASIQSPKQQTLSIFQKGYWKRKFQFFTPLTESRMFPIAATMCGGVLLFMVFWPQLSFNSSPPQQRFSVAEIPFDQSKDRVNWNHEQTIPPGTSVIFSVNQGNQKSYLFRMASSRPVRVIVRHEGQNLPVINPEQMTLHGVRYATLKQPKINDAVMIQNNGTAPIKVNAHTEIPQAMKINFTR